jgi:hypothetical protein
MQRAMLRRVEDEIRSLCKQLLAGKDDEQLIEKLVELRAALRLHIERMRARVVDYPVMTERRRQDRIPPPESPGG